MSLHANYTGDTGEAGESRDATVILFLSFSILTACIAEVFFTKVLKNKFPLPFTVTVLMLGFIIGIIITQVKDVNNDFAFGEIQLSHINPHLMYYIFLPLLIFDAAFNGHFHVFKQQLLSAILLAGPGVMISTAVIALCAVYIFPYNWNWLVGLLFGSIVSATDTVAVVALLHESGASSFLASLVDAESLLNDGSAFVMFLIFRNILIGGDHSAGSIVAQVFKYSLGGPAFGLACGMISVMFLDQIYNKVAVEITFTMGLAYLVFYVADVELGVSAMLALVTMGLYMSKNKYCISSYVQPTMTSVWRITTYFVNILIFAITGLIIAQSFIGTSTNVAPRDFGYSIVLFIIIILGRILTIVILYPFIRFTGVHVSWKDCVILVWSGLRGSMALILVLIVSLDPRIDNVITDRFLFHVSMIVLLTLILNGTSIKYVVKLLGLHQGTKESDLVILQALEHMRIQTSRRLAAMKEDQSFVDVDWQMLNEYLPDKLLEELDEEHDRRFCKQLSSRRLNEMAAEDFPPESPELPRQNGNPAEMDRTSGRVYSTPYPLATVPSVYQTDRIRTTPRARHRHLRHERSSTNNIAILSSDKAQEKSIRNELIQRFLTAVSIDYERQWYLGMIRRKTLNILIKSVEQAKLKRSFKLHWQLIMQHFQLSFFLQWLIKFDRFHFIHQRSDRLLFDHIFQTIEIALGFHSAKTRLDSIRYQFPELGSLNERIMNEVCEEVKMYQINAMHILLDLQKSYRSCWTLQMTRRCAQMILKFESVAIIQLYETGMLDEREYSQIIDLIEVKLYTLENGKIKLPRHRKKTLEDPFDLIPHFQTFSREEKSHWKNLLTTKHEWFQPGAVLLEEGQHVSTAYLIIRGIVQCKNGSTPTYYKCGNIVGIDALYTRNMLAFGTYTANGGLVEAYAINSTILRAALSNEKLSRSVYNEIAFHSLMNNYRKSFNLSHSQLKTLLSTKAQLFKNQPDYSIDLEANERLFLLSGSVTYATDDGEVTLDSLQFTANDYCVAYRLSSSSVVFTWKYDDEIESLNSKKFKITFSNEDDHTSTAEAFYPVYSGGIVEFTPRRQLTSMTRPVENSSNFQFIPTEMQAPQQRSSVLDFSPV